MLRDDRGWIKHFTDGSEEIGTDKLIQEGQASWRNGRLDGISSVTIQENRSSYMMVCSLATEWWQGDKYHAKFTGIESQPTGDLVERFVQLKVNDAMIGKHLVLLESRRSYTVLLKDNPERSIFQLEPEHKDMWLTMAVVVNGNRPTVKLQAKKG
jgi:hypothetical protein